MEDVSMIRLTRPVVAGLLFAAALGACKKDKDEYANGAVDTAKPADTTAAAADDVRHLSNHARDEIKDLTDKAAGADWDKNYMDKMVDDHQKVLDKLQDASKNTTDPDVTKALEAAVGKVQTHLTKAQDIR